jgi:hypothetical protein
MQFHRLRWIFQRCRKNKNDSASTNFVMAEIQTNRQVAALRGLLLTKKEKSLRMHANNAEWVLFLRRCIYHITQLEKLDEISSIVLDPPSSTPDVYMNLFMKIQTLASVNDARPVGAPMMEGWLTISMAIGNIASRR